MTARWQILGSGRNRRQKHTGFGRRWPRELGGRPDAAGCCDAVPVQNKLVRHPHVWPPRQRLARDAALSTTTGKSSTRAPHPLR